MQNPQIEQFYQLGKLWRQTDDEQIQQKTAWYKQKQADLKLQIEAERESIQIDREALERDFIKMEKIKKSIESQQQYVVTEKQKLLQQVAAKQQERQAIVDRVEELRRKKMNIIIEKTRCENTMMKRINAKEELFKKLQDLDEKRIDANDLNNIAFENSSANQQQP